MRFVFSLIVLVFSAVSYATKPSLPLKKIASLGVATATPESVGKAITAQASTLQKLLNTDSRVYRLFVKEGEPRDILSGAVSYKDLPAKEVDFIWDHPQVTPQTEGPDFRVQIPLIAKRSYGILKEGRFLVKLVPQMGETSGIQTAAGSTVITSYRFLLSEVEASALVFYVDKQGTVFNYGL